MKKFTQIDHRITRSSKLSAKAFKVYAYILSMKTGWHFSAERMTTGFKESPDFIRSGINELISLQLIEKRVNKDRTIEYQTRFFHESKLSNRQSDKWKIKYLDYLDSPEWKKFSEMAYAHHGNNCMMHLDGCKGKATQIHHIDYDNLFNERLEDVMPVCSSCHKKYHSIQ